MRYTARIVSTLSLFLSAVVAAQTAPAQPPADQLQKANQAFATQQWAEVLAQYTDIAARFPAHALSRFRVGIAQMELGRLADAEKNLREGERLGVGPGPAAYRLGQLHGEAGRTDSAVTQLVRSATSTFFVPIATLEGDPHLAKVKATSRWSEVVNAFDAIARPCMHDSRYRELDFWIGEWDVRPVANPAAPASESSITLEYSGCVVHEHWRPANNAGGGESFNMYDRSFGQWRQTWVDAFGGQHDYKGKLEGKNMVYYAELPPASGQGARSPTRMTFFNISPDSVRQFGETSADGGKTWSVAYDLLYVRRKKAPLNETLRLALEPRGRRNVLHVYSRRPRPPRDPLEHRQRRQNVPCRRRDVASREAAGLLAR